MYYFILFAFVFIILFFRFFKQMRIIKKTSINSETNEYYCDLITKNIKLKKYRISFLIFIIIILSVFISISMVLKLNIWIDIFCLVILFYTFKFFIKIYNNIFRKEIISKILEQYDNKLIYNPSSGITKEEFRFSDFANFDSFASENLIIGDIEGISFKLSDIKLYDWALDSESIFNNKTLTFQGSIAILNLPKDYKDFIYIIKKKPKILKNQYYIDINNKGFNKKYDVYSSDSLFAEKILTDNFMNLILELINESGIFVEIKLKEDIVYFRFYTVPLFCSCLFSRKLEEKYIIASLNTIKHIQKTIICFLTVLNEIN